MHDAALHDVQPTTAMVLAAGLGTRMRPLTDHRPKPLIEVAGKALIDHVLDALLASGIERAVVNVHYLADQLEAHLARRTGGPEILISDERDQLLETGGGIAKALPLLGDTPFVITNADSFWKDGATCNLDRLIAAYDRERMAMLLMLAHKSISVGHHGAGDFLMEARETGAAGPLTRRPKDGNAPFVYCGTGILDPKIFANAPAGAFSLNLQFDAALAQNRLYGLPLDGLWLHVGTPDAIALAEKALAERALAERARVLRPD